MQNADHQQSTKLESQHGASESEAMGKTMAPPTFQLKADGEDPAGNDGTASQHKSLKAPPFQLKASNGDTASPQSEAAETATPSIQRKKSAQTDSEASDIPESPSGFPFEGKILPDAAKMYVSATPDSAILATLPKNQTLQVLGGDQWLHCQTTFGGKSYDGYVLHSDIKREMAFTNTTDTETPFTSLLSMLNEKLLISKEVNFFNMGGFAEQGGELRLQGRMMAAVKEYLSDKFKLRIQSPDGQTLPGDGVYPISVRMTSNPSAEFSIELYGGHHGLAHMDQDKGEIYELGQDGEEIVSDVTLAHESAHAILGASDEYAHRRFPNRKVYTDHSLLGAHYTEGDEFAEIKDRHFEFLINLVAKWFPDRLISILPE